jgi:hypothetical protein
MPPSSTTIHAPSSSRVWTPSVTPIAPHLPSSAPSAGAATTSMPRSSTHAATNSGATVEYIDAADAGDHIIYNRHVQTLAYIRSLTAKNIGNLEKLIDEPYICRWPEEWTNKGNAMKKSGEMGDETRRLKMRRQVRFLNCIKMHGLGTTSRGYMIVRDHKGRGDPFFLEA